MPYIISEMLFDYSKCNQCVNNILSCEKCKFMSDSEARFETRRYKPSPDFSNMELKLQCLSSYCPRNISLDSGRLQARIKDVNTKVIDNVEDDELRTVMKSFVRQGWGVFREGVLFIGHKETLKDKLSYTKHADFKYRNKLYPMNIILKLIIYEYLIYVIDDYFDYIEIQEVQYYLDDIFN